MRAIIKARRIFEEMVLDVAIWALLAHFFIFES